ncbi:MAG: aspartate/glutamate racemase family protein [Gammaproteobacteria bacterium]|nr:aspartate/glutamate racemase family protein [Gammaproteobacteria bacterium]
MRILLINPNTTQTMTDSVVAASQRFVADDVEIFGATSDYGPPSIEGFYDEVFSIPPMLEKINTVIQQHDGKIDGVVIACFDDTGVDAARAMLDVPVVGICQAALQTASLLSNRFSIITTLGRSVPALEHLVSKYGFANLCRNVRASEIPVLELEQPGSGAEDKIRHQIELALEEDNAEAIVLGCAGMVDLTERLSNTYNIPVIEGVVPAVNIVSGLSRAGLKTSKRRGYATPVSKNYKGEFGKYSP